MKTRFSKFKYYGVRLGIVVVSTYFALFLAEIVLWRMEPKQYLREMYRNLYDVKDGRGVLKPGYYAHFDEGIAHGEIRVNSHGYRGHEPSPDPKKRILLLGASFTFGVLLDQKETIDARMEEKEPGLEVDNLGVIGYYLPQQLGPLRDWTLPANQVVYLFYYKDFKTAVQSTIVDGYLVPRLSQDGTPRPDEVARLKIKIREEQRAESHRFKPISSISLPRVRRTLKASLERFRNHNTPAAADLWPLEKDYTVLAPRSLGYTLEMRNLAAQRNMEFYVAILPGVEEVRDGKHFTLVTDYIAGLRAAGVPVIDLLPKLSVSDYWSYDPHFNPKGAQITADEIYKALKKY